MIKIIGILGASLVLGAAVAATIVMGLLPLPFGPAAEARAAAEKAKPPVTVMYPLKEQVVNLSDKAATKYLKAAVTLEFIDSKLKDPPQGAAVTQQQTDFAADMTPYAAIIQDAIVSTLSSKTSADLLKTDGKDQLKNDLITNVNHALHDDEKVVNVYFTSFIIQ
ncbi:MAG: flagellar basal body-associated FliL family protein [Chloroflexi bacterium]|nr:flagellar basal body-associated FliL family protein [Chloroflexota bacterium]MBV9895248.1 flagellar basal body-associated FliL family protein [Chloroflexota bacterium]